MTALGTYTLQLEAGGILDTMDIVLYEDACDHAQNQEGFEWIPGDLNQDCVVNELDEAIMLEHWLEFNLSVE